MSIVFLFIQILCCRINVQYLRPYFRHLVKNFTQKNCFINLIYFLIIFCIHFCALILILVQVLVILFVFLFYFIVILV